VTLPVLFRSSFGDSEPLASGRHRVGFSLPSLPLQQVPESFASLVCLRL